ncbi:alpha/beta-hydrolase [Gloeophyllum trabeum ATCC 11539]|uniref:Alpha/beta-hydrolase n=1 Tax=Gloeophyllum trabeum (strain ATCC 11539 / FP-39264 / Madison 617) TaxID=670483 RepID=S7QIG0_GLOTA|nr:alpha/beta-hydrolase [Gloeophyllum trabeum ATCC 11539]EPQ59012.1 alpha/beta-hydrolase [Gloeophyllum trabeum ATCC 11539]
MGLNTFTAAVHITPVVIKTFLAHSKRKGKKFIDGDAEVATDDIFFDEAFHIVKAFLDLGTYNTIESFQAFTNTHVPAPPWAAVAPVVVPLKSCNRAADVLIDWFGPEDLEAVVGGERWWQVRGLDGIEAEWVTEKEYLSADVPGGGKKNKKDAASNTIKQMEHLETVMLYVPGGGYFFGSINTHRYQVIRYARKMKGRAFVTNYRKAPQYPWPCPLHDVLASYLYLIEPPEGAPHKPVHPSKIVFAGDSAGGGLCVAALTVIRDMGLPMPAGAVLISPWVDLTHSFPSVMQNMPTDIIPAHGFMAKPSLVWPVAPVPPPEGRVIRTRTNPPPKPGHADDLKRDEGGSGEGRPDGEVESQREMVASGDDMVSPSPVPAEQRTGTGQVGEHAEEGAKDDASGSANGQSPTEANTSSQAPGRRSSEGETRRDTSSVHTYNTDLMEPSPPKVLMHNPDETPLELRAQIQIYATNEQLTHPLVSPILQGSLGNLCPLYILVGDGEVLRDEGVYLAHRAAHPDEYPVRHGVLKAGRRQKENAEKYRTPTKVHLQVYDGMCHVLTVFTFTDSAKYAYRSISQFIRHVTIRSEEEVANNAFPELHKPPTEVSLGDGDSDDFHSRRPRLGELRGKTPKEALDKVRSTVDTPTEFELFDHNKAMATKEVNKGQADFVPGASEVEEALRKVAQGEEDVPDVLMIRERVDIHGKVRAMEPREEVEALKLKPSEIGVIKEDPCRRWLTGQELWDKKFRRQAIGVVRRRRKYEARAEEMLANARAQGLQLAEDGSVVNLAVSPSRLSIPPEHREMQSERRWGPLDLERETPPPSAICKRRDTPEALALIKKSIYYSAPSTHRTMPKLKVSDAVRAAFDPNDHPTHAPRQSVSEQQLTQRAPIHGLSIWTAILTIFMRKSSQKARDGRDKAKHVAKSAHGKLPSPSSS